MATTDELLGDLDAILFAADRAPWRCRYVAGRALERLGLRAAEWLDAPDAFLRHVHPEDRERAAALLAGLAPGVTGRAALRMVGAGERVVGFALQAQELPGGRLLGLLTEIDPREAGARDQLGVILQAVADGITVQDASGRLVYANEEAAALIGAPSVSALMAAPRGDVAERFEMWTEAGRPLELDELPGRVALRTGRPCDLVLRFRRRGAPEDDRFSQVRARPVLDESGRAYLVITAFHDMTERRRRADELAFLAEVGPRLGALEPEPLLAALAELAVPRLGTSCRTYSVEADGRVVVAAHAETEGGAALPDDAAVARVLAGGLQELVDGALVVPLVARGRAVGGMALARAPGRSRYRPEDAVLARRLAERAGLLLDNARLYAAAQRAIAVRDDFLAIAAHDLRSPLSAILVSAGTLRAAPDAARVRRAADAIIEAAESMERLVHDLVDLGAIEAGRLSLQGRPWPARELVRGALSLLEPSASQRSISLVLEGEGAHRVLCDRERIQQVLTNLVGNAIQFSSAGATVRVIVEARGARGRFAVVDTGAGIDAESLPHIFDRYWQARRHGRGGVGLGLSIAQGIVAAHGGALSAESEPGRGSRFSFDLPLA